jgi:hypothetical protein
MTIPQPPEKPYLISSTGPYHREQKIILMVMIPGYDNTVYHTTAMINYATLANFIDL